MRTLEESKISIVFLLLLLFSIFISSSHQANEVLPAEGDNEMMMVPLGEEKFMVMNETRRKLGSFQICSVCTCCGGAKGLCLPSPCCYAINCNIPNRPFGYCSFTPKTCNCFGCHI
ncbi:hypothetical protein AtNW77_Chr1g0065541 [Arabidopsis thaliana]|uniref:Ubiquitin carboxyl-terminal hydrolase n=3 Tax=Arabidopsis TaxID=3701 RepID=Q8H130_ARATH|nr:ubiquitin carboxyl-terminal hydrolase [Arabidopsis thaliana]AAN41276.1 unknown protein [Arabidopsis thaliana]AEE34355.1 ubiquitin carboxyl-terminal hydrolase [Arabidopsis thaliana]KAG7650632.1 hypothetical protein ISN45_At01g055690 [Arabidopsis thaliana x Arabidopsis arenosa]|eukprot:NP_564848.1 ubiquitin carboxyl-terminal hydrolase [Arabidopsis thaliana]